MNSFKKFLSSRSDMLVGAAALFIAAIGAIPSAEADGLSYRAHRKALSGGITIDTPTNYRIQLFHPDGEPRPSSGAATSARLESGVTSSTFEQALDHFAPTDPRTFRQRYFIHSAYVTASNAPVLFIMCGEGTCDASEFRGSTNAAARTLGAHMVVLEHRYYGESQPFAELTAENLKYLSTAQALEDNAEFQEFAAANLGLTGKWLAVGGSYSGNLSAFYRLRHPELVVGAIASSAPVRAKADFEEYDRHVATVAGPQCAAAMREVTAQVEAALAGSPDQVARVKAIFASTGIRENLDFLYVVADMAAAAVQYGMRDEFCNAITSAAPQARLQAYATAGTRALSVLGVSPEQDAFQYAESLNPADYVALGFGLRQWMYQSCTEYGYFQVADHEAGATVRSTQIDLEYHRAVCERLFGIQPLVDTTSTNRAYYQQLFVATLGALPTRIFFSNGSNDPWSRLSISTELGNATNAGFDYAVIPGAAHCDDLRSGGTPAVRAVQAQELDRMQQWLR